jgi:hypothetical protein
VNSKHSKSFESPDETIEFPGIREEIVDLGDASVARVVQEPGWRWSKDMRSVVEGEVRRSEQLGRETYTTGRRKVKAVPEPASD